MADLQWHYASGGQKYGPIDEAALHGLLSSGALASDVLVWNRTMTAWTPAFRGPEFVDVAKSPPPVPESPESDLSAHAYSKAREASGNAFEAFKILLSDPMGGQGKALSALGESKALPVGVVFLLTFIGCGYVYGSTISDFMIGTPHLLFVLSIPPLALTGATLAVGKIFSAYSKPSTAAFTAGVALLPAAVMFLFAKMLGEYDDRLRNGFTIFPLCMIILLLNAGLMDVHKLSTRKAFLVTPVLILITIFISAVLFVVTG